MAAAKAYRNALLAMSSATAAFASAMEACSRCVLACEWIACCGMPWLSFDLATDSPRVKGCRSANAGLAGTSGLQFLVANHEQLLADAVYRQFEIPLLEALDHYKLVTADRLAAYEKNLHDQSGRIRKTEAENLKVARRRKRGERSVLRSVDRGPGVCRLALTVTRQIYRASEPHWPNCRDRSTSSMRSRRRITRRSSRGKTR